MKALVTGGAGFIGSNLVDALLARGDEVTVLDDLSTGRLENLEGALANGATLVEADIRDRSATEELAGRERPEVVFHLAAQIDVRKSIDDPAFDASINVGGTANVLEAARAGGSRRIVFVSTGGAIYGEGEGKALPLGEDSPVEPLSAYGQSKFAGEGYLALYQRLYGLSSVALRLGNVYGPRQDPLGEAGVIAIFCGRLRAGRAPDRVRRWQADPRLHICGRRGRRGDRRGGVRGDRSDQRRHRHRDRRPRAGPPARRAGRCRELRARARPARTGEVQRISIDPARAARELGWSAQTGLAEGLRLTLDSI